MPTAILTPTQQRIEQIITDAHLLPKQKKLFLALTAESELPYMPISPALSTAKDAGIICHMLLDYGLPLTTQHQRSKSVSNSSALLRC